MPNISHFFRQSEYTNAFIKFAREYYDNNHFYIIDEGLKKSGPVDDDLTAIDSKHLIRYLNDAAKDSGKVIFHGAFNDKVYIWSLFNHRYRDRVLFSIWGGELYSHKKLIDKTASFHEIIMDKIKAKVFKKQKYLLFDMPEDYNNMQNWFGADAKVIYTPYPHRIDLDKLDCTSNNARRKTRTILLGNSATETNNHEEIIRKLSSRFRNEDVIIYCPLSYGNNDYRQKVVSIGEQYLGKKFVPLVEYMEYQTYIDFLKGIDVAIFNNNRQQAMGNIMLAALLGIKIYIRDDTVMWNHYVETNGCRFSNTSMIDHITFDELWDFSDIDREINKKYFEKMCDDKYIKSKWDEVLI